MSGVQGGVPSGEITGDRMRQRASINQILDPEAVIVIPAILILPFLPATLGVCGAAAAAAAADCRLLGLMHDELFQLARLLSGGWQQSPTARAAAEKRTGS